MADFDEPTRRRRPDGADPDRPALSTTERLERLRDGLQKGVRSGGEPRRLSAPGALRSTRAMDSPAVRGAADKPAPSALEAELGARVEPLHPPRRAPERRPPPADPSPGVDAPSLVRSMLSSMPATESAAASQPAAPPQRPASPPPAAGSLDAAFDPPAPSAPLAADLIDDPRPTLRPPPERPLVGAGAFSGVERMLAARYLRARRKEGFISVIALLSLIGIALGVATLIIVMSVMNGFRAELVGKIVGVNGHFTVRAIAEPFRDFDAVASRVRAVPGVTRAAPLIEGQAFASTARNGLGVLVRGMRRTDLLTLEDVAVSPEFSLGSLSAFEGANGVAVGQGLALRLGVSVGDTVTLISPRGSVTPFGVVPKRRAYKVLYIFKVGMAHYDAGVMFMPLEEAQTFFNKADVVDAIELMVATPEDLTGYREEIRAAANRTIALDDWQRSNQSLMGALKTERTVMFLILSMLILIASLIIISGLIMLVKEKGPDIAILRTMGLSRGAVLRVFFMCGAAIGVVGTVLGVALGVAFCLNIETIQQVVEYFANGDVFPDDVYILSKLPARLHWEDVGLAVGISLGLSFLATLYPAWRAARLDPVEALRYE